MLVLWLSMLHSQSSAHSVIPHHGHRLVLVGLNFLNRDLTLSFHRLNPSKLAGTFSGQDSHSICGWQGCYPSGSLLDPRPNFCYLLPTELFLIPQMLCIGGEGIFFYVFFYLSKTLFPTSSQG